MHPRLSLGLKSPLPASTYAQRGTNALQAIFREYFQEFAENYEQKYAPVYGRFRPKRITQVDLSPSVGSVLDPEGFEKKIYFLTAPFCRMLIDSQMLPVLDSRIGSGLQQDLHGFGIASAGRDVQGGVAIIIL